MAKIIRTGIWIFVGVVGSLALVWCLPVGWQVLQKYRPRVLPFTGSGTVIDEKTGEGIPDVYVLLRATGYTRLTYPDIAPEGSINSHDWYSGSCQSVRAIKTDANGHYAYSISPQDAFEYPWPYSVGFYIDFVHADFVEVLPTTGKGRGRNGLLLHQNYEPSADYQYFVDRQPVTCRKYVDNNGLLQKAMVAFLSGHLKHTCRNEMWYGENVAGRQQAATAHPNTNFNIYSDFVELANQIDHVIQMRTVIDDAQSLSVTRWKSYASQLFGQNKPSELNRKMVAKDDDVKAACLYFSQEIQRLGVSK
jgi:hypothetical protein